jgi:hypothetical protein
MDVDIPASGLYIQMSLLFITMKLDILLTTTNEVIVASRWMHREASRSPACSQCTPQLFEQRTYLLEPGGDILEYLGMPCLRTNGDPLGSACPDQRPG